MPDLVRVRVKGNGLETTVGRVHAEASEDLTVLDEPACFGDGTVRPVTRKGGRPLLPATTVEESAAKKPARKQATKSSGATKKASGKTAAKPASQPEEA